MEGWNFHYRRVHNGWKIFAQFVPGHHRGQPHSIVPELFAHTSHGSFVRQGSPKFQKFGYHRPRCGMHQIPHPQGQGGRTLGGDRHLKWWAGQPVHFSKKTPTWGGKITWIWEKISQIWAGISGLDPAQKNIFRWNRGEGKPSVPTQWDLHPQLSLNTKVPAPAQPQILHSRSLRSLWHWAARRW